MSKHQMQNAQPEFEEVPGLRAAYAAAEAAQDRHALMVRRVEDARAKVASASMHRDMLMRMAAAGKDVLPAQLRVAEEYIRDAEASVTLTSAAVPTAKKDWEAAVSAVDTITRPIWIAARDCLFAAVRSAEATAEAARLAVQRAHQRANMQQLPPDVAEPIAARLQWHKPPKEG